MVPSSLCCNWFSCHFWWDVVSDHWSSGNSTRDLRIVFRVRERPVYLREALLSRKNQIPWHTLLPLLLLAPRRWLWQPSSDFERLLRYPIRQSWRLSCFCLLIYGGSGRQTPLIGRWKECSFVLFFELIDISGKFPRVSAGASLFSGSLYWRSVLKFHGVCAFSDVRLTQCSPPESYTSNWSEDLCALPKKINEDSCGSASCDTQPNCRTLFTISCCTFVTTLLGLFIWLFLNLPVRKRALFAELKPRFRPIELTFGRMSIVTRWLHGCRRILPIWLLPLTLLFLDPLLPRSIDGSEGGAALGVGFGARSWLSCRKLHWSPFEHYPFFFFPLVKNTFSSFNAT